MKLAILGAADTVTGSRYLVEAAGRRVLVDCGLFQGPKRLRERNWAPLPIPAASLDAVVLTHAHLDHAGYLPRLLAQGFAGPVYCTPGTRDLLGILLPDAAHLQEEEARHAAHAGYAKHAPPLPLSTRADAEAALARLAAQPVHAPFPVVPGLTASFARAGHIVGAASVQLVAEGTRLTFSGDVGRLADPILRPPEPLAPTDALVVESTYGDRLHPHEDVAAALARVVTETIDRGGTLVIPAFAVGRAQHVLHLLAELAAARRIPTVPVYLDSPMAIDATALLLRHAEDHTLTPAQCSALGRLPRYTRGVDESKAIDRAEAPAIVIAGSGMATGGRVLHHLVRYLPDARHTVLLVGFQAAGTRGRSLLDGAPELKLLGQYVPVRARIAQIAGLSAHADYGEILTWLRASGIAPRRVFVTHGEPAAADALRRRLAETFGWKARAPELGEAVTL